MYKHNMIVMAKNRRIKLTFTEAVIQFDKDKLNYCTKMI